MTYIDYANRYWRVARANFATNNCAFLYFFLLDYVNGLRWQQPFRCPTALITGTFHISKQQVINARQELVKFGLIIFKEGTSRQVPPVSTFLPLRTYSCLGAYGGVDLQVPDSPGGCVW